MKYSRVYLESMGYELAPVVVTSREIERRLAPVYQKLNLSEGQLENLTGIKERRWWEPGFPLSKGAIAAAKKALAKSNVSPKDIEVLIYGSVGRECFEPATACLIAAALGVSPNAHIYDISNACLGAINGMVEIANRIELGQIRAGMVVCCESARDIYEIAIKNMLKDSSMQNLIISFATLTGGSGASAFLITDGSFSESKRRKIIGAVSCADPQFHELCHWGMRPNEDMETHEEFMRTDGVLVLKHGVELVERTWEYFLKTVGWSKEKVHKTIMHQVGKTNRDKILKKLGLPEENDFVTYPYLGNIGSASLPINAAIAEERDFLKPGENVAFMGIGSGLNCLIVGLEW